MGVGGDARDISNILSTISSGDTKAKKNGEVSKNVTLEETMYH